MSMDNPPNELVDDIMNALTPDILETDDGFSYTILDEYSLSFAWNLPSSVIVSNPMV